MKYPAIAITLLMTITLLHISTAVAGPVKFCNIEPYDVVRVCEGGDNEGVTVPDKKESKKDKSK